VNLAGGGRAVRWSVGWVGEASVEDGDLLACDYAVQQHADPCARRVVGDHACKRSAPVDHRISRRMPGDVGRPPLAIPRPSFGRRSASRPAGQPHSTTTPAGSARNPLMAGGDVGSAQPSGWGPAFAGGHASWPGPPRTCFARKAGRHAPAFARVQAQESRSEALVLRTIRERPRCGLDRARSGMAKRKRDLAHA
jgi:hypothetical protein